MKILILGFSRSGSSSYDLLKENNEVFIYDKKKLNLQNYYSFSRLKKELPFFDLVIRSPGVKQTSKVYQLALTLTNKMISEIELGLNYIKNNLIIGVTGSNGKTTLVNIIYHLLKDKFKVHKLGNIGTPLTKEVKNIKKDDIVILELSSFQLENTYSKYIDYGIITNLSSNHFDSVFSKEVYIASKLKLIKLSKKIYLPQEIYNKYKILKKYIKIEELDNYINNNLNKYNQVYWNIGCSLALKLGISKQEIESKKNLFFMEHFRMEKVKKMNNLVFINDSKSTSIAATNACLDVYNDKRRIIILGGVSKKENFKNINKKENDIILSYGKDGYKIFKEIGDLYFTNLEEVVKYIKKHYIDIEGYVIFSPGCASFDQFSSYIERGNYFNELIKF